MISNDQNKVLQELVLVSEGKRATAEAQMAGFEAGKAIDGRSDTCWAATPYYKWWKIDLLQTCQISRMTICTSTEINSYTHYFIEYSQDNLNWQTVAEKMDDTVIVSGEEYEVLFKARYIRVTITYCSSGESAQIYDFKVFGQEVSESKFVPSKVSPHKIPAMAYDEVFGFSEIEVSDLESGQTEQVLIGGSVESYIVYRGIDFTKDGVDQLRGYFGFTDSDKSKRITMEVRVDDAHGEKVGEIVLFRQWKAWSILGGQLEHSDASLLTGVHDVYLIIKESEPSQRLMIHWLAFVRKSALPPAKPRSKALRAPLKREYKIYFGNLHSHTDFSDGEGVPEHAFDYARYTAGLDFLAITEHSNLYDHYLDWDKSRKWKDIQLMAQKKTEEGAFLALVGAETTWYNQFGHMNTFNLEFFINAYETKYNEIPVYYEAIKQYPDSIHQWNHPWSSGNRHLDGFEPYDAELDEVLHLLEVNPIISKENGGLYYYVMALDKGWHLSPAGNQDNHHGQWGTANTLRTAVLVDQLTQTDFFDAVRHQRVYFTSALHLKVWFKINGSIMGSKIKRSETLEFNMKALYGMDTGHRLVKAEIYGEHGRVLHTIHIDRQEWEDTFSLPCKERYYFVKIYQDDGEFAVTSPIWIEGE
ncbi:CehA/McbA family metallohydrolase [Bacillus sp. SD088]|uniref:CehA/McbA family metallohydrolase n=1 Tax=Bacillus sp. SD088 TaxID=2782012 RepID=UPI001A95778A|nr:CehA/McbA family metallohydrolase [Bacillus sp. SD088]MBO0993321.1 CehA/McbA family metallohydrolase [Bacillus sp. SD088]